ncbi:multiple sugar transport system permease protein/sn-glycerol 3-phosphate transport system permease protein [Clavibacter michiganensis]|uniref:carbohydrate ABC transporter permease n=1 Tax=Clavibacter michiganensis TaxID=28447 RepID=UPI001AE3851C|nr:carbohydrate ABC transporter permease [Clavibacter michiganensis]MBP2456468.1 multiple sugar transport system permease protein/sn-glycerol 3-phosphate transport system permease protein [Clavibacter michiganensis]MDQ0409038.1 multiple sugar transport system permease protein/sn-glycerol 3-phosphate transport system permease protein [Clavibacter michiganensis]
MTISLEHETAAAPVPPAGGSGHARPARRRRPLRRHLPSTLRHVILIVASVIFFGPFIWMVLVSFKSAQEALSVPPTFLPTEWHPENYTRLFEIAPFGRFYVNTIVVAVLSTAGQVITSLMAGYAFARLRFRGRNLLFLVLLAALMVPFEIVFTPLITLLSSLGWLNSYQGLIVPNIPSILGVFLFRQFFSNFPSEIEDAARMDGTGVWQRFRLIMAPMATPMIGSFAILSFVYNWNNFFFQFIAVNRTELFTVQIGLTLLQSQEGASNFNLLMAGSTLAVIPVLVVFLLFQGQIVKAISGGLR